jgi:hypothetical protein
MIGSKYIERLTAPARQTAGIAILALIVAILAFAMSVGAR